MQPNQFGSQKQNSKKSGKLPEEVTKTEGGNTLTLKEKFIQIDNLDLATRMVNFQFGQEYEKRVNAAFYRELRKLKRETWFKPNIKFENIPPFHAINKEWTTFQKKEKTRDELALNKPPEPKEDNLSVESLPVNRQKMFDIISGMEIDGAAYIPPSDGQESDVIIKISEQDVIFTTPCLILIETTVQSDIKAVYDKLFQLMKDYALAKTDSSFFYNLICDEQGKQTEEERKESKSAFRNFSEGNIHVYLVCVTNNKQSEGRKNFHNAWNEINKIFDLSKIYHMHNWDHADAFDHEQFKEKHVKHIHIPSTPFSNFLSNINEFQTNFDNLDKDVGTMKGQLTGMNQKVNNMEGQLTEVNQKVNNMEGQLTEVNQKVNNMEGQLTEVNQKVNNMEGQMTEMGKKMDKLEDYIAQITLFMKEMTEAQKGQSKIKKLDQID